ncbi:hypothetical protein ABZV91_13050 [Nocardia sp. NPDC004568]|uniref:hypothetical protein n=1 Tax=Nocardia sp. NPDC004568 TaxID=3154551 RepID=UPI0033B72FD3
MTDRGPASTAEFLALLRQMAQQSPRSKGQIAAFSEIPRSTAYSFMSPTNTALPSNPDQVRKYAKACGLDEPQVEQLMRWWKRLDTIRSRSVDAETLHPTSPVAEEDTMNRPGPSLADILDAGDLGRSVHIAGDVNITYTGNPHNRSGSSGYQRFLPTWDSPAPGRGRLLLALLPAAVAMLLATISLHDHFAAPWPTGVAAAIGAVLLGLACYALHEPQRPAWQTMLTWQAMPPAATAAGFGLVVGLSTDELFLGLIFTATTFPILLLWLITVDISDLRLLSDHYPGITVFTLAAGITAGAVIAWLDYPTYCGIATALLASAATATLFSQYATEPLWERRNTESRIRRGAPWNELPPSLRRELPPNPEHHD